MKPAVNRGADSAGQYMPFAGAAFVADSVLPTPGEELGHAA